MTDYWNTDKYLQGERQKLIDDAVHYMNERDEAQAERDDYRATLVSIAQYHPDWTGRKVNDWPDRQKLMRKALDVLVRHEGGPRGHDFVQNPRNPNETDCDRCGVMWDFHRHG